MTLEVVMCRSLGTNHTIDLMSHNFFILSWHWPRKNENVMTYDFKDFMDIMDTLGMNTMDIMDITDMHALCQRLPQPTLATAAAWVAAPVLKRHSHLLRRTAAMAAAPAATAANERSKQQWQQAATTSSGKAARLL